MLKMKSKSQKKANENRQLLSEAIGNVEKSTSAEIVAIVKAQSDNYFNFITMFSVVAMFIVFTYLMFSPTVLGDYMFYTLTLAGFIIPAILLLSIQSLKRLIIPEKAKQQAVEIKARAIFQKAGISLTRKRIGLLVYCSLFEKMVYVVVDEGIKRSVPYPALEQLHVGFQKAIATGNPIQSIADEILKMKGMLALYIPKTPGDMNELPDDLDIEI
jgi:putative membrane protein